MDIGKGNVGILVDNNQMVGTGSRDGNHITRVYVLPEFQGKGYGSFIMKCLEDEIAMEYHTVQLDASLPVSGLYEHRGYHTIKHEKWTVENGELDEEWQWLNGDQSKGSSIVTEI